MKYRNLSTIGNCLESHSTGRSVLAASRVMDHYRCWSIIWVALTLWASCIPGSADVALPKFDLIGIGIEQVCSLVPLREDATLPQSIRIEINKGKVSAIVCDYSDKNVRYSDFRAQVETLLKVPPKINSALTCAWRQENEKRAVMVTWDKGSKTIQLILRSLETKVEE